MNDKSQIVFVAKPKGILLAAAIANVLTVAGVICEQLRLLGYACVFCADRWPFKHL